MRHDPRSRGMQACHQHLHQLEHALAENQEATTAQLQIMNQKLTVFQERKANVEALKTLRANKLRAHKRKLTKHDRERIEAHVLNGCIRAKDNIL